MKKSIAAPFILGLCIFSGNIVAQIEMSRDARVNYAKYYWGPSGGFNFASMFGSGIDQIKYDYGIVPKFTGNFWLLFGYKPVRWLCFESGASIVGKGLAYNEPVDGYNADYEIRYSDLFCEFPLIIKPTLALSKLKILYGVIGLSYSKQLSAKYTVDVSYEDQNGDTKKENLYKSDLVKDGISFPIDTMGGKIVVPYKDLFRMNDVSLILGTGLEIGGGGSAHTLSLVIELKYLIGLRNQSYISPNADRLLSEASEKLTQFMIENHLTAKDIGINNDGEYISNPVHRYNTFLVSIGFKHYF